jgi:hypothetical protein
MRGRASDLASAPQLIAHYQSVRERLMGRPAPTPASCPRSPLERAETGPRRKVRAARTVFTLGFMHGIVLATCMRALEPAPGSHGVAPRAPAPAPAPDEARLRRIVEHVSRFYGLSASDLISSSMSRRVARARQTTMYLMWALTETSLPDIGRFLGGRRHSTVVYARNKVEDLAHTDPVIAKEIRALKQMLASEAGGRETNKGDQS